MKTRDKILEMFPEEEFLFADDFDGAIVGVEYGSMRVVYSIERCITILQEEGLDEEDAMEHFYYNVAGSYVGEKTPIFIHEDKFMS